jgi:hypothetical protein
LLPVNITSTPIPDDLITLAKQLQPDAFESSIVAELKGHFVKYQKLSKGDISAYELLKEVNKTEYPIIHKLLKVVKY